MKSKVKALWAASVVAGVALGVGVASWNVLATASAASSGGQPTPALDPGLVAQGEGLSRVFEAIHHSIKNAVVNISVIKHMPGTGAMPELQIPLPFRKLLPPGAMPMPTPGQGETLYGTGSGVIISPKGYIVTNNHVVSHATKITVTLADGRHYKASVVGTDPKTDLAVVKISAPDLTYAHLGNSNHMHVGDWVLAFGSPLGFSQTMTHGIISAKGRTHVNIIAEHNPSLAGLTYEDFIQTDAAINPGNSGGPLVNMKGSVIGINSAIATSNGGFSGIGFSIPSNEVKYVANALIKYGKVVRGYLGVSISDVRHQSVREVAETFGYHGKHGVLVQQIEPGTPAANGGLKKGDIITTLNGKKVMTMNQLRDQIAMTHPGDKVTLGVFRNGKDITLTFPLGTQPQTLNQVALGGGGSSSVSPMASKKLGVTIAPVTPAIAKADHMAAPRGVVVTNVAPNGLAASVGVAPGDIILSVQGVHVNSPDAFDSALKKLDLAKGVRLSLRSPSGVEQFVFVKSGN